MSIEALKGNIPSYAKDLKLNLSTLLAGTDTIQLSVQTIAACALAAGYASSEKTVIQLLQNHAREQGVTEEVITAIKSAAAVMSMNNVYYRTMYAISNKHYASLPAQLRMHILQQHGIKQTDFELYCLVISAVNGCGHCVNAHVHQLEKNNIGESEIHYSLRVASVIKGVAQVLVIEAAQA